MRAFYNDTDRYCCAWLSNLMDAGLITPGTIDDRPIQELTPDDVRGYERVHCFAGIAGWDHALNLAGWGARPVWTGSCPCQPFSAAGKGKAADDERHLWPAWFSLIRQCRPATVFGEQVEAAIGWGWIDAVFADLESESYACGTAVLPASGIGAPHIRQRLWFVADATGRGKWGYSGEPRGAAILRSREAWPTNGDSAGGPSPMGDLGDTSGAGLQERERDGRVQRQALGSPERQAAVGASDAGGMVNATREQMGFPGRTRIARTTPWSEFEWLPCTDGKARPVEPGTFPLAPRLSACLGRLRAIEDEAFAEIITYGTASKRDADEALRMVRDTIHAQACRQECATGMCEQFHAQEVLFDLLLCRATTCNGTTNDGRITQARDEAKHRIMRMLRRSDRNSRPPCGFESHEQFAREPANALHVLSFVLARHAQTYWQATIDANAADGRVAKLRAIGNSIVPQVAAQFIIAANGLRTN